MRKSTLLTIASFLLLVAVAPLALAGEHEGEKEKMEGEKTLQGCLSDGPADGWYVLAVPKDDGTKEVSVEGDDSFEGHLGHEVKLTGKWVKKDDGKKYFQASGMEHISTNCP